MLASFWRGLNTVPKRKKPPLKPKEQFERFVETARALDVDETGKEFERAFKKAVPPKRSSQKRR
jgi:hypothetical protein